MSEDSRAVCPLCPRHCALREGESGACAARENRAGQVVCANYGQITSLALDPIEKKPLYHFHSGSQILSVGGYGCNLFCPFCQNYAISRARAGELPTKYLSPEALTTLAQRANRDYGSIGVAFTYNEPLVSYEYVRDAARLLKEAGLLVVLVTNGQICADQLGALLPYVDALNIDLKGFSQKFYDWLGGDFSTTKAAIERAAHTTHVEVTTLVIPGKNDSEADMEAEADFLAAISPDLPLHLSRYFPRYRCAIPVTPRATLERLAHIARAKLCHVHLGNL